MKPLTLAVTFLAVAPAFAACASADAGATDVPTSTRTDEPGAVGDEQAVGGDASVTDGSARDAHASDGSSGDSGKNDAAKKDGAALACSAPLADCDQNGSCETDVSTDEDHCGACGSACPFLSRCVAGACQAPLERVQRADGRYLVADDQRAYWLGSKALQDGGFTWTIRSVPHTGAASITTIHESSVGAARDVALAESGADLYIATYDSGGGAVRRVAKTGGAATLVGEDHDGDLGGNVEPGVGASGGYVFWIARSGIFRKSITGAAELWTKTFCARDLLVQGGEVYWTCYQGYIAHRSVSAAPTTSGPYASYSGRETFAVDNVNVYTVDTGGIQSEPLGGGAKSLRAAGAAPRVLATDGTSLYYNGPGLGGQEAVYQAPLSGGPTRRLFNHGQILTITTGGQWVYFTDNAPDLFRAPK